jgi:hypothetical protein
MFHQLGFNNESRIWFGYVLIVDHISKSYLASYWDRLKPAIRFVVEEANKMVLKVLTKAA